MIDELRTALASTDDRIRAAAARNAELAGGLLKSIVEAQLQVALLTRELILQRIAMLESGAPVTLQVPATAPDAARASVLDLLIQAKKAELVTARADADRYSGGLVAALKQTTVATVEQTIATLELEFLTAKYGLAVPAVGATATGTTRPTDSPSSAAPSEPPTTDASTEVVIPHLANKRHERTNVGEGVFFDVTWHARSLLKPARMIKGVLVFRDLFGEAKFALNVTIDKPLLPGRVLKAPGIGFDFNQFMNEHRWVLSTDLTDMKILFKVKSILYDDGRRQDFS